MDIALSPELALVCPDLRAAALAALPDRDPDGWEPQAWVVAPRVEREPFLAGVRATLTTGALAIVLVAIVTHLLTWAADGPTPQLLDAPPAQSVLGEAAVVPEPGTKPPLQIDP